MRNVKFGKPIIEKEETDAVLRVLAGDILVHGPLAKEFETHFAQYTEAPHAVSVSSCTAGLHLSYYSMGIGQGDEVIVPAQTHVATAHAVELTGAKPIFVDAEIMTGNIDIEQIEDKITSKTKVISLVHYLGMPVNMDKILSIAQKHQLKVVEDCALAIGSKYKGKHVGTYGNCGCYSFYPVKHMTTAEGGMITTTSEEMAKKLTREKAFGVDRTVSERKIPGVYDVNMLGYNYRMNEIQASIGIEQIKKMDRFLKIRKDNYEHLESRLKEIEELDLFQSSTGEFQSSYYCLSVILKDSISKNRFEVVSYLKDNGVGTSVYYPRPVPHFTYYKDKYGYTMESFPVASRISYHSIALPVGPHLSVDDMDYITLKIKEAIAKYK